MLALDLRRESLAFLWIRARRAGLGNLKVILSAVDDPRVPPGTEVHAALIANTLHEMLAPGPVLDALGRVMPTGARLVVIDRAPLLDRPVVIHELSADDAQRLVTAHGFHLVERVDSFVARDSEGESWWLMTFRR